MVACGSNTSKTDYGKTIGDYLQKGKDYNFKVIEIAEVGTVTVADSIEYLTGEFRKDKQLIIDRIQLAKKMSEDLLAKEKKQSEIQKYNADISVMNQRIDSLKNLTPDNLSKYSSVNNSDVLAVIVRCKYSLQPEGYPNPVEEHFDFTMAPDGKTVYSKTKAK